VHGRPEWSPEGKADPTAVPVRNRWFFRAEAPVPSFGQQMPSRQPLPVGHPSRRSRIGLAWRGGTVAIVRMPPTDSEVRASEAKERERLWVLCVENWRAS